jgi:U3 small nucleolar RNA-associated protein 22
MLDSFLVEDVGAPDALLRRLEDLLRRALGDRIVSMRAWTTGNGNVSDSDRPGDDSDEIPTHAVVALAPKKASSPATSATAKSSATTTLTSDRLVVGLTLNSDTCHRLVDRGPPADDAVATQRFLQLWGQPKAQLRRFQDGAIVYAVVWNDDGDDDHVESGTAVPCALANDDRMQGGIVQKIIRHIVSLHFTKQDKAKVNNKQKASPIRPQVQFSLPHLLSVVDGVKPFGADAGSKNRASQLLLRDPIAAHRQILNAFEALSSFLRTHSVPTLPVPGTVDQKKSRLGLPLAIDAVEPLSPALRYSELFPPLPHPALGDSTFSLDGRQQVVAGVIMSDPIVIQIRFGQSSKWPTDLKAIAAAKTAMLIQLANGIDDMKQDQGGNELCSGFQQPSLVTPTYLDLRFKGYLFRVVVRADPELHLLRNLQKPSLEATALLRTLTKEHVVASMHHSTIHAVHTMYPSASAVVRLAKRWMAAHMLSGLIPIEAVELIVAKVYADQSDTCLGAPTTAVSGFMRFLHLLSRHDWAR